MKNEFERIDHHKVNDIKVFLIDIDYRRPHLHTDLEIIYVMQGQLTVKLENKVSIVPQGHFYLLNTCQLHEFISDDTARLLIVQFNTKSIENICPEVNEIIFDNKPIKANQSLYQHYLALCHSYFNEEQNFHIKCHAYAILVFNELLNQVNYSQMSSSERDHLLTRNERIAKVSHYIQRNAHEKILLSDLALEEQLSTAYLSNFIKTHFGYTFQELVNFKRCELAKYQLMNTQYNLLTISQNCGFSDVRYLNKAFQNVYGITPQQFRTQPTDDGIEINENDNHSVDIQMILHKNQSIPIIQTLIDSFGKRLLYE